MAKKAIEVTALKHKAATRLNIPTAEFESVMREEDKTPVQLAYERRNRDLDPQLVWRGKDEQDWSDLIVAAPPLYIQEKVHPKVIIDELKRETKERADEAPGETIDLFADFNGLDLEAKTEFYQHGQHWSNRMISGDSLQVMASLAEREGLRGQVQCIYFDPPYGIKFNSNFQWSTTSRDVKDGAKDHLTREPEQVRAFRDTWRDGIHSYLTYLRDRLTVARDLLHESGSIFVQIGDENVDKIKTLLEEVFGQENFVSVIVVSKTSGFGDTSTVGSVADYLVWFARKKEAIKYRPQYLEKDEESDLAKDYKYHFDFLAEDTDRAKEKSDSGFVKLATYSSTTSQGETASGSFVVRHKGKTYSCPPGQHWKTHEVGFNRLVRSARLFARTNSLRYVRLLDDYRLSPVTNLWSDLRWGFDAGEKRYVVETNPQIVARCLLMTTDPGDLVLESDSKSGSRYQALARRFDMSLMLAM
jgi:adenine-specific DNA-methyltransferase